MTIRRDSTASDKKSSRSLRVPGSSLGIRTGDVLKVAHKLKQGLPYEALARLQRRTGLPWETIAAVTQLPPRTLARRKVQGKLTPQESERLYRLACVVEKAIELFGGDVGAARQWLEAPNRAFSEQSPLEMTEAEIGAREVEDLIGRLEHGVFA
jgi:putative toxin-antitoxin system antitoxin component (TIGR02293 family)